jgi:hypothetical protein
VLGVKPAVGTRLGTETDGATARTVSREQPAAPMAMVASIVAPAAMTVNRA